MSLRPVRFSPIVAATVVVTLLGAVVRQPARGAEGLSESGGREAETKPEVLRYHRVYAPADRHVDWPGIDAPHMPMDAAEFERLVKRLQASGSKPRTLGTAIATSAVYRARLAGTRLADGHAALDVKHSGSEATMLFLDPCGLAIGRTRWLEPDKKPVKAVFGFGGDGKQKVRVDRSGQLEFDWSLAGRRDAADVIHFRFELPPCPATRLVLDLPEDLVPVTDNGIVLRAEELPPERRPQGELPKGFRRWQIELGGRRSFRLRVVSASASEQSPRLALVRQSVAYDFSLRGVEVLTRLNVEVHGEPVEEIALAIDRELQLVTVRYGDAPVPWSIVSDTDGKVRRVLLELPEPIRDTGRVLRLSALAPLVMDKPWQLPRIQPQGMFWQEGNATLLVPAPLLIKRLVPSGCWQSGTGPLPGAREGESAQFQYFSPDATIGIVLSRHQDLVQLTSGTAISIGGGEMTARVVTDLHVADTPRFSLPADVSPGWLIDSVESLPAGIMDDWAPDRRGNHRLTKALSPSRPVRLLVTARRLLSPLGRELGIDDLVPLRFCADEDPGLLKQHRRLVAIDAAEPYEIKLAGAEELDRIDPQTLDAPTLGLFAEPPRGLVFEDNANAAKLRITLQPQSPSYSGTVRVEAGVVDGQLREKYAFHCVPQSARVDRVLVHFSHRRDTPPQWTLGAGDGRQISARQWSVAEQGSALLPPEGETWELTFRSRSVPFEIHAVRRSPFGGEEAISLASLPKATRQEGTLVVRSSGVPDVRIENHRLKPVPAEPVPAGRHQTALATFHYDPSRDMAAAPDAAVTILPLSDAPTPPIWVWDCQLDSRYDPNGLGQHLATYRLQNSGVEQVQFSLASGVAGEDVRGVWVDDKPVTWRQVDGRDGSLAVDLPPGEKFPAVAIHFVTRQKPLGTTGSLRPLFPETGFPVFSRHWTVWLPPGYGACGSDPRWQPLCAPRWSLSRRLFGPLGQTTRQAPFDPLGVRSWNPVAGRSDWDKAVRQAELLLKALGTAAPGTTADGNSGLCWSELLSHKDVQSPGVKVRVDREALARLALSPQSPVEPVQGNDAVSRGGDLLRKTKLALLVHPNVILLTSQSQAALYHAWLVPLQDPAMWRVLPGPLHEQLHQAAGETGRGKTVSTAFVSATTWSKQPAVPGIPWNKTGLAGLEESDLHGWSRYQLEVSTTAPARLKYVYGATMRLLGTIVFLLTLGLAWWKANDRPVLLASLAGGCALLTMLLSEAYVPVASGALLGILFCLVLRLVRRRGEVAPGRSRPECTSHGVVKITTQLGILAIAALAIGLLCSAAFGQESAVRSPTGSSPSYHVFIPIGDNKQPTGGKVYLPIEFYNRLRRLAVDVAEQPEGWLLGAATYHGTFSRKTGTGRLALDKLKAGFDLNVFSHGARVRIPWQREGANLLPGSVTLDGRVIQPEWDSDNGVLTFDVPQQGQYRLELLLHPTMQTAEGLAGFDMAIPRLATSRLELLLPPGVPKIEVPSAMGPVGIKDNPLRLVADLGSSDRLTVRWPVGSKLGSTGSAVDVEELLWLKIQPGSVVVDARFKLKIVEGQLSTLQLATDPRLRLLPLEGDNPPSAEVGSMPGQPRTITLTWPQPLSGEAVAHASFLWTGKSGIGNLRLPELRVLDARTTRRWVAVSLDPRLDHTGPDDDRVKKQSVPDFLALWGETDEQPRSAFRLAPDEDIWSIATRAQRPRTSVEQTMAVSFDERSTEVRFDADLTTEAGHNFQHRLLIPRELGGLQVEHVSVRENDVERVARFAQGKEGGATAITVFLTGPVTGSRQLSLRGRIPTRLDAKIPIVPLQVDRAELLSSKVELFRRPAVLVTVNRTNRKPRSNDANDAGNADNVDNAGDTNANRPDPESSDPESSDPRWGRFIGAYHRRGKQPLKISVTVSPNRPDVRAEQVTRLLSEGMQWSAAVDFRISVTGGLVDQFRIDAPRRVHGPYGVTGAIPASVREITLPDKRRQLIVRPEKAIDGEYRFTLSSPIALSPSDRPFAPDIVLQQVDRLDRLLALPSEAQGQPIAWETWGLKQAELPEGLAMRARTGSATVYRVVARSFRAVVRRVETARATAHVRLADVRLAWRSDGTCYGVAAFDIEPGRSSDVSVHLPEQYELVGVSVAGVPAVPDLIVPGQWRVPLGPEQLPQRIEVLFKGTVSRPTRAGRHRFEAPTLGDIPVERTLWTVAGPPPFKPGKPVEASRAFPWEHELARVQDTADRIESASLLTIESPGETRRWYRLWAGRMVAARANLSRELSLAEPTNKARAARSALLAADRKQAQIARRLGTSAVLTQLLTNAPLADDPAELWQRSLDRPLEVTRCTFDGKSDSITLSYHRTESARSQPWLSMSLMIVLVFGLIVFGLRRGTLTEWSKRWPAAIGVAVGLFWWLWLSPSILGWVIVLVSLIAGILPRWKMAPAPPPDSSIIPIQSSMD